MEVMTVPYSALKHCMNPDQWTSLLNTLYSDGDDKSVQERTRAYRGKICILYIILDNNVDGTVRYFCL